MNNKKGFEMQFHWILVLIAGALILTFFLNITYRQQEISQQKTQIIIATEIENILTLAQTSKGTTQTIPTPRQGITYTCTPECNCQLTIGTASKQINTPLFAPEHLEGQDTTIWTQEFKQPYRTTNFVYLTNPNTKYYVVTDKPTTLQQQITKTLPINYENITTQQMPTLKAKQQTKFILLETEPTQLDPSFEDYETTAIKIDKDAITFYEKQKTTLTKTKYTSYTGLPTIYAAIYAQNQNNYECGLKQAFKKLAQVAKIYADRTTELQQKAIDAGKTWCDYGATQNICPASKATPIGMLCDQHAIAQQLTYNINNAQIHELNTLMQNLESQNRNYIQQSCPEMF